MLTLLSILNILPFVLGQTPPLPAKGDNGEIGGIFGLGATGAPPPGGLTNIAKPGSESPKPGPRNTNGGSGPYKAAYSADPSLPDHTVYAPVKPPPANVKVPVLVWGNGGCRNGGSGFSDFLTEISSYGYIVIANGPPGSPSALKSSGGAPGASTQSHPIQLTQSVDWIMKGGPDVSKYGSVDTNHIAAGGQSCGGLEAYSASYHDDRIKLTLIFNSGITDANKTYLLKELKAPVGYFLGGPLDVAYPNVRSSLLCPITGISC
jgi:dienelactone hydrolase